MSVKNSVQDLKDLALEINNTFKSISKEIDQQISKGKNKEKL